MGKKYNTTSATVRPIATEEVAFLVEAWEGIKPSRKAAVTMRVARETERPANWRPKTDKQGKRPAVSVRERSQDVVLVEDNLQGCPRSYQVVDMSANWQMVGNFVRFTGQRLRLLKAGEVFLLEISWSRGSCSYGFGSEAELRDQLAILDWADEDLAQQLLG